MSKPKRGYHRSWKNFLLDKKLQLRYVAFVTVLSAGISGALGYLIWRQEAVASASITEVFDSDPDFAANKDLRDQILSQNSNHDTGLVVKMAIAGLGLVIILSLYLVIMTHKVAGPLFKVSKHFDQITDGKLGKVWPLRKGDMLQSFFANFKAMHDAVRARYKAENDAVTAFLDACEAADVDDGGEVGHQLQELRAHRDARVESLA